MQGDTLNDIIIFTLFFALLVSCFALLPKNKWAILLKLYYRRFRTVRSMKPSNMATLVVANHPNAFIDPFAIEAALNVKLTRTVRADWTKHWLVRWFTQAVGAVPLASQASNKAAFTALTQTLNAGKAVILFPEGESHNRRTLKPFKKGAAYLAKQYIESTGHPIRVVKVALYYEDKSKLNTNVWVDVVGESIYTDATFNVCQETKQWREEINTALPSFKNTKEKQYHNWLLRTLYSINPKALTGLKVPQSDHSKSQITLLHHWLDKAPINLSTLNMTKRSNWRYIVDSTTQLAILGLGLPLFLLGFVLNSAAIFIHYGLVKWQSHAEDKWASNAFVLGLVVYPVFWLGLLIATNPGVLITTVITGMYANFYAQTSTSRLRDLRTYFGCLFQPQSCADIRNTAKVSLNLHSIGTVKTES